MENYTNIVTRLMINDNVLPYSSEEGIFNSSVFETLTFDIKPKFGDIVFADLIENATTPSGETFSGFSETTQDLLDSGLQLAIMYYVVARTLRKTITPTRFGSTIKTNMDGTSENATNSAIVTQSNYYKSMADDIVKELLVSFQPTNANKNVGFKIRIIGE